MLSGYVTTGKSHFTKCGPPKNRSNPAIVCLLVDSSKIKLYLIRTQAGNWLCRLALVVSLGDALSAMDTSTSCINQ